MDWILASASPRRKALLGELIKDFEIIPAKGEENADGFLTPADLVQGLARQKAEEVAFGYGGKQKYVLGSDTVVALDGKVLGKPKTEQEAKEMLRALSGRTHDVYTGVCISYPLEGERKVLTDVCRTEVVFENLSERFIDEYVKTGSPMDKAGAYGIQDGGLVKEIKGSYSNVVGLPLELVREMLAKLV